MDESNLPSADIDRLLKRLYGRDIKDGYDALLELERLSDESGVLYPYTQAFADMISSDSYHFRVRAFRLFCRQARWDKDFKLDENIDRALKILNDPKPTAVRQALSALSELMRYKPDLRESVLTAVQSISYSRYKDSMQGLIFKDAAELSKLATESIED